MRWVLAAVQVLGVVLFAVGALWLLQGSDLVHLDPVLCAADCAPVSGWHPGWQLAGAAAMGVGAAAVARARRAGRTRD